jgi:hypothetical protein
MTKKGKKKKKRKIKLKSNYKALELITIHKANL